VAAGAAAEEWLHDDHDFDMTCTEDDIDFDMLNNDTDSHLHHPNDELNMTVKLMNTVSLLSSGGDACFRLTSMILVKCGLQVGWMCERL
jgi:hypothetical protein